MILNTSKKGGTIFLDEVTVKIKDGDILGYFTVEELSKQSGATEGNIRQMVHRGQLQALEIGRGHGKLLYFPKDTIIPLKNNGKPRKGT